MLQGIAGLHRLRVTAFLFAVASAKATAAQPPSNVIVKSARTAIHPGGGSLVHRVTIGGAAAPADYLFAGIQQAIVLNDGSVCVADGSLSPNPAVVVFGRDGRLIRTIGRMGKGPGEFTTVLGIAQTPDGRIFMQDPGNQRIAVFSATGQSLTHWPFARGNRIDLSPGSMFADTSGMIYVRMVAPAATPANPKPLPRLIRILPTGKILDTVPITAPSLAPTGTSITSAVRDEDGASRMTVPVPYAPEKLWTVSPLGYLIAASSDQYSIELRIAGASRLAGTNTTAQRAAQNSWWQPGDPITAIRRTVAPIPVSSVERADRVRVIESGMRTIIPQWRWSGREIPQVKPALKSILATAEGRIWASVSTTSERFTPARPSDAQAAGNIELLSWRERTAYDVFEPDGSYVGQVSVPYGVTIAAVRGEDVWGITRDSDDQETLQLFRLVWR